MVIRSLYLPSHPLAAAERKQIQTQAKPAERLRGSAYSASSRSDGEKPEGGFLTGVGASFMFLRTPQSRWKFPWQAPSGERAFEKYFQGEIGPPPPPGALLSPC